MPKAQNLVLTQSQAACLFALRQGNETQPRIALGAKLALAKTAAALRTLARIGLAEQDPTRRWHATGRGKVCRFETVPDRPRQNSGLPGPAGRRVLKLLDRPMRGREIVEKLGMTHQGVRQLLIKLHAQGHIRFADPENSFWFIARADDKTSWLSRDEERVLSVIPRQYATAQGAKIYAEKCVACHAEGGKGGAGPGAGPLVGGEPLTNGIDTAKTIANYYAYATTVFDYIRRAMPYNAPRSLADNEVYALTAYILSLNKLIGENDAMDAKILPQVKMPNRDNWIMPYPDRI